VPLPARIRRHARPVSRRACCGQEKETVAEARLSTPLYRRFWLPLAVAALNTE
jgi:hypothetical protein